MKLHWWRMSVVVPLVTATALLCASAEAAAQGRITNAKTETRSGAKGVADEVQAIASRGVATWIGYRAPLVPGPRQMCCYDTFGDGGGACCGRCRLEGGSGVTMSQGESRIALEPPTEFVILARVDKSADLLRQEVRTRCINVQTGNVADWPFAGVRRHADAGSFGGSRDLPQRRNASHMRDVGLENIHDAQVDQLGVSIGGNQPLAGGDG